MNGELSELFTAIKDWSAKIHEQRHRENLTKFDKIFDKLDTLVTLKSNVEWLTWSIRGIWLVVIGVVVKWMLS